MGSYSYFDDEDIEVKDWDGLKLFLQKWKEHYPNSWINMGQIHSEQRDYSMIFITKDDKGNEQEVFSFRNWDDIKLISYFYNEELLFLELVAPYIEGRVEWNFESKDEAAFVEFEDNKCIITTGNMNWGSWDPSSQRIKERDRNYDPPQNFYDIPEELFKLKLASCLGDNNDKSNN